MNTAVEIPRCHVCGCSPPHPPAACPLVESVEYHRNGAVAKITKRPPAPAADREKPDRCRAPHCWSEYGTPCGDCPSEPRPDPDVRDGDWRCLCGDLNREHEACCFRCGGGNPAEPMPDEPFFTDQQERSLARCEAFDRASEPRKETT